MLLLYQNWEKRSNGDKTNYRILAIIQSCVTINMNYLYNEKPFTDMLMNQLYAQNKDNLFIKYYRKSEKNFTTVGIYKKDALDKEKILLNTIFQNKI